MYETTLVVHGLLRWAVVAAGLYSLVRAFGGMRRRDPWMPADVTAHRAFVIALDVQVAVGLFLGFVVSPITTAALADVGTAMRTPESRFWLVEHPGMMVAALVVLHVGFARAKRAAATVSHRRLLTAVVVAVVVILAATPWPCMPHGRPWVQFW